MGRLPYVNIPDEFVAERVFPRKGNKEVKHRFLGIFDTQSHPWVLEIALARCVHHVLVVQ